MISEARELESDRKLFKKVQHQHNHVMPEAYPQAQALQSAKLSDLKQMFLAMSKEMERLILQKLEAFDRKIFEMGTKFHRMEAVYKMQRKQSKSAKFLTPSPKNKNEQKNWQTSQTVENTELGQKRKQQSMHEKQPSHYLVVQFSQLKQQINELRSQLSRSHAHRGQIGMDRFPSKLKQFQVEQFQLEGEGSISKHSESGEIRRLNSIITQFKKQEQIMKFKTEKYRNCLALVLKWLKQFKEVDLMKLLPCQACELKNILRQYLMMDGGATNGDSRCDDEMSRSCGQSSLFEYHEDEILLLDADDQKVPN